MRSSSFEVKAGLGAFGAEVTGDLNAPLDDASRQTLRDLLWEHEMLVFRGQDLTHARQIEVMEVFAPVLHTPEGAHYISTEKDKGVLGRQELPFHSDLSFVATPRLALSLHAVDVVDGETSTKFISATRAVDRLPSDLRDRLEALKGLQVYPLDPYMDRASDQALPAWLPRHAHPVLMLHPVADKTILYVMEMQTVRVEGLPIDESRTLIEDLLDRLYTPDNLVEHFWFNGDIVIWDNVALQHARGVIETSGPRTLQKVQTGIESFEQQWPAYSGREMQAALAAMAMT